MEHRLYAQVVGSIMYAMLCTRPDLSFAVSLVSRFQSNLGEAHWVAVKRILRYIKGTKNHKMTYSGKQLKGIGYSNFDFSSDTYDGKCTSGYIFLLGQGAISQCSKKQSCVAKSTMEVECIACSSATSEVVWIKGFLKSLNIKETPDDPIKVMCDNQAAIC